MPCISTIFNSNTFKNKRIFILAGGPSLTGFDYSKLNSEITIGINKTFQFYNSTMNFSLDLRFHNLIYTEKETLLPAWKAYPGIKVFARWHNHHQFPSEIYTIKINNKRFHISEDPTNGIFSGCNSAYGAMMLAISCGCRDIYFVGLDLKLSNEGKTHNHDGYKNQDADDLGRKLIGFRQEFENTSKMLLEAGIDIKVCYQREIAETSIRCFPLTQIA